MMTIQKAVRSPGVQKKICLHGHDSRGVALVTTLLLLSLMVAMTLGMVIAVTSDSLITRYYRTYRSSFYGGDSGVNIARQYMLNQLVSNASVAVGTTFSSTSAPPLSASATRRR